MLDRLLDSTYSAFDKDPNAQIAFRMRHPAGLAWKVRDRVLTASTEAGAPLAVIALREKTIDGVVELLAAAGCEIVYQSAEYSGRAADSLLAGSGRQSASDGDAFRVYDSTLYSMLDAYAQALEDADVDIAAAIRQLYLGTAEGEWIDEWGGYYGLQRDQGELDDDYRVRILVETLRPRVNAIAIQKAVLDITGKRVKIYEPWVDLFILSGSDLSGAHKMHDGEFYTHNVIQPQSAVPISWDKPLEIIDRNRPAGTLMRPPVFKPATRFASFYGADPLPPVLAGRSDVRSTYTESIDPAALGYLALSDYESIVNYRCNIYQLNALSNPKGVNRFVAIGPAEVFTKASVCLSEDAELGGLNCMFGLQKRIDYSDLVTLSGTEDADAYALSEGGDVEKWVAYDEATMNVHTGYAQASYSPTVAGGRADAFGTLFKLGRDPNWIGKWDARKWRINRVWGQRVPIGGG